MSWDSSHGSDHAYKQSLPGTWCTQCGSRPGIAGPAWICRVCVAGGPHKRIVMNPSRRPLPAGTPGARERYRAAGLCHGCGRDRDRADRKHYARCRRPRGAGTARGARERYRARRAVRAVRRRQRPDRPAVLRALPAAPEGRQHPVPGPASTSRTAAAPGLSDRPAPATYRGRAVRRVRRRTGPGRPEVVRALPAPGGERAART